MSRSIKISFYKKFESTAELMGYWVAVAVMIFYGFSKCSVFFFPDKFNATHSPVSENFVLFFTGHSKPPEKKNKPILAFFFSSQE